MPQPATISDIQTIARREALLADKKILGITASEPRYVFVPDESADGAVQEFVIDVHVLEGPSQQTIIGLAGGLALVTNVLVASTAVGDVLSDLHVPVEIQKIETGQLQVVGRAKVALPTLRLTERTYEDLGISHLSEFTENEDGSVSDAFGYPVSAATSPDIGPRVGVTGTTTTRLSTLDELNEDDDGATVDLGVNALQRVIILTQRAWTMEAVERVAVTESEVGV